MPASIVWLRSIRGMGGSGQRGGAAMMDVGPFAVKAGLNAGDRARCWTTDTKPRNLWTRPSRFGLGHRKASDVQCRHRRPDRVAVGRHAGHRHARAGRVRDRSGRPLSEPPTAAGPPRLRPASALLYDAGPAAAPERGWHDAFYVQGRTIVVQGAPVRVEPLRIYVVPPEVIVLPSAVTVEPPRLVAVAPLGD